MGPYSGWSGDACRPAGRTSCLPTGRWSGFGKRAPRASSLTVMSSSISPPLTGGIVRPVIFEAMAVEPAPWILPGVYEPLFKDAAIYAEPDGGASEG